MHETVVVVGMAVLTRLWSVHMFSSLRRKVFTVEGYCGGVVCVAVCGGCGLRPEAEAGDSATHRHFPRVLQREREGTQAATGEVRRKGGQVKEGERGGRAGKRRGGGRRGRYIVGMIKGCPFDFFLVPVTSNT